MGTVLESVEVPTYVSDDEMDTSETIESVRLDVGLDITDQKRLTLTNPLYWNKLIKNWTKID